MSQCCFHYRHLYVLTLMVQREKVFLFNHHIYLLLRSHEVPLTQLMVHQSPGTSCENLIHRSQQILHILMFLSRRPQLWLPLIPEVRILFHFHDLTSLSKSSEVRAGKHNKVSGRYEEHKHPEERHCITLISEKTTAGGNHPWWHLQTVCGPRLWNWDLWTQWSLLKNS